MYTYLCTYVCTTDEWQQRATLKQKVYMLSSSLKVSETKQINLLGTKLSGSSPAGNASTLEPVS